MAFIFISRSVAISWNYNHLSGALWLGNLTTIFRLIFCCIRAMLLQLFAVANALFIIYLLTQRHTLTIPSVRFKWVKHIDRIPWERGTIINIILYCTKCIRLLYQRIWYSNRKPARTYEANNTVWCWWHYIRRRWIMCTVPEFCLSRWKGMSVGAESHLPHTNYGYCLINFSTHSLYIQHRVPSYHKCKIIPAAHFYCETWELWHL